MAIGGEGESSGAKGGFGEVMEREAGGVGRRRLSEMREDSSSMSELLIMKEAKMKKR